jgi:hypothetical protein
MSSVDQAETTPVYRGLSQMTRRLPPNRGSKPVHVATVTRWILKGCRASDGSQIKLRATRFPSGWRTTDQWVEDFLEAITRDRTRRQGRQSDSFRTPFGRLRDIERAERDLSAAGF